GGDLRVLLRRGHRAGGFPVGAALRPQTKQAGISIRRRAGCPRGKASKMTPGLIIGIIIAALTFTSSTVPQIARIPKGNAPVPEKIGATLLVAAGNVGPLLAAVPDADKWSKWVTYAVEAVQAVHLDGVDATSPAVRAQIEKIGAAHGWKPATNAVKQ